MASKTVTKLNGNGAAVAESPAETQALVPAGQGEARAMAPQDAARATYAGLAEALSRAQGMVKGVEKDAKNTFHKYKYASMEALIGEGKAALSACGLALVPVEQALDGQLPDGLVLLRKFLLLHASGEKLPLQVVWPVCPEKGRPVDKAMAAAATSSLGYLLRDLLLMPRVDEEIDQRDDTAVAAPAARAAAPAPAPAKGPDPSTPALPQVPGAITAAQLERLAQGREALFAALPEEQRKPAWADLLKPYGVASAKDLTAGQADAVIVTLAQRIAAADRTGSPEVEGGQAAPPF